MPTTTTLLEHAQKYVENTKNDWNYITPQDFYTTYFSQTKKNFLLLDVRKPEDYQRYHVKGSTNIFWLDLFDNLDQLDMSKKIFIMCYVGHTASQAMTLLRLLGYDAVAIKYGLGVSPVRGKPVAGWLTMGYPMVYPCPPCPKTTKKRVR